MGDVCFG